MHNQQYLSPTSAMPGRSRSSASLVALPSMSHSLSALPTMSGLPKDMLHYGTTGTDTTKGMSEAKLDSALQKPRTTDAHGGKHIYPSRHTAPSSHASMEDNEGLLMFRTKRNSDKSAATSSKAK